MLSLEITNQDLEREFIVSYVTNKEMQEIISSYHEDDVSIYSDADLISLIEDLLYNGYSFSDIQELNDRLYGDFLEFYFIPEQDMYVMIAGVR